MANQYHLTEIPDTDRERIVDLYKSGIGVDTLVKQNLTLYGRDVIRRVLREEHISKMSWGGQEKYKSVCSNNKICPHCKIEQPKAEFERRRGHKNSFRSECRKCHKEKERIRKITHTYNITIEEYNAMLASQKGLCACCEQSETSKRHVDTLSIDHNHETGKIRQLLCHRCNVVLGFIKEDLSLCHKLAQYITRHHTDAEGE